jgi:hypothetical protein
MRRRSNNHNNKILTANVAELTIRGSIGDIIRKLEGFGYQAEREKNNDLAHVYFQAADHYKREMK